GLVAPSAEKQSADESGSVCRSGEVRAVAGGATCAVGASAGGDLRGGERSNTSLLSDHHHRYAKSHRYGQRDQHLSHAMSLLALVKWNGNQRHERKATSAADSGRSLDWRCCPGFVLSRPHSEERRFG